MSAPDIVTTFRYLPPAVTCGHDPSGLQPVDAALVRSTVEALAAAAPGIAALPIAEIVEAIDRAIARWLDPDDGRRRQILSHGPAITGYAREALQYAIDVMLPRFRADELWRLLRAEIGDPDALDGFVPCDDGPRRMARGRGRQLHVLAGSVPTVPIFSLICALLVKSPLLLKPPSRDPLFPALFARTLAMVEPRLANAIAVLSWPGGSEALERVALEDAGVVVAYGADATIADLRRRTPAGARFVGYGNRISLGAVAREALTPDAAPTVARALAWDVALFDQRGCLSPQFALVERGGPIAPQEFAALVAGALADLEQQMPRGLVEAQTAARVQALRAALAFSRPGETALWRSPGSTAWTVLYAEWLNPAWLLGGRTLGVVSVDDLDRDLPRLAGRLPVSTIGVAGAESRPALATACAGVATRVCPLGTMGEPPITWRHDGLPNLPPLLEWVEWEPWSGERSRAVE